MPVQPAPGSRATFPSTPLEWLRLVGNAANLSTPAGLLVAAIGRARVRDGPRGLVLADGYRLPFPVAGAFTVGNVVITAEPDWGAYLDRLPTTLQHEERHSWQWLALGPAFLPAYTVAMGWSWLRTGDRAAANVFEQHAGLALGGYRDDLPRRAVGAGVRALIDSVRSVSSARSRTRADGPTGHAGARTGADAAA